LALGTGCLAPASALADFWSERVEIHGRLSSRAYFRTPSLDWSDEFHLASWRNQLTLEALLRLQDRSELRVDLVAVARPTYDAVYDLYPEAWGERTRGGDPGTGSGDSVVLGYKGQTFPGHGACVEGEFCLGNLDAGRVLTGRNFPGIAVNKLIVTNAIAPWAMRGGRQPKVGGSAAAEVFSLAASGDTGAAGAAQLAASLARAGTEVPGSAPAGLGTPLNSYAGGLGDRGSLKQLPADINRTENELKFGCFDNSDPHCWLHELYLDVEYRDTFLRLGRQQIVWGKTDSFQLQDLINPTDEGIHNIFPSLDERRMPVWAARVIHTVGTAGPFEDVSVELAWVVDRFRPRQIGQCGEPYAFVLGCQLRTNAAQHGVLNLSLAEVNERSWKLKNTEPGARIEFYLPEPSFTFSLSAFWGFQDLPVLESKNPYSTSNPNPAALLFLQGLGAGRLIDLLANGLPRPGEPPESRPWVNGFDPYAHGAQGQPVGTLAKANQDLLTTWNSGIGSALRSAPDRRAAWLALERQLEPLFGFTPAGLALPWSGSELVVEYPRVLTLGGSMDYEIAPLSTVLRVELAYDIDRGLMNTAKASLRDDSDVFKLAIGLDRPTRIPFLTSDRAAFISVQTFWEHILDYDDGRGHADGMIAPENGLISTFFIQNSWRDDSLILTGFLAVDWSHQAWGIAPTFRWRVNDHLSLDVGLHLILGRKQEHGFRDVCPDGGFSCLPDPTTWNAGQWQVLNRGLQRAGEAPFFPESFGDHYMEQRDEIWVGATWEF
jgi:hypothetical protein